MQTYERKPGETWAEITMIEYGRFLIDFTPRGVELLAEAISYPVPKVSNQDIPLEALRCIIDEQLEWCAWSLARDDEYNPIFPSDETYQAGF